jgi:chaperone required for assembly of F1-ATPase
MKRFYQQVAVDDRGRVLLDGKPVKTPGKREILFPGPDLARAAGAEWDAQTETVDMLRMPLTLLAFTATDRNRSDLQEEIIRYAEHELLCYRSDQEGPLRVRQQQEWQPWLDWAEKTFSFVWIPVVHGFARAAFSGDLDGFLASLPPFVLAGFYVAVRTTGSVALALAVFRKALDVDEALNLARLEELFQAETWGGDPAALNRRDLERRDLAAAQLFMEFGVGPTASVSVFPDSSVV